MQKYKFVDHTHISRKLWDDYVKNHKFGTIFHTPYMFDVWNTTPNYESFAFFVLDQNAAIRALIVGHYQIVKSGFLAPLSTRAVVLQAPIFTDTEALVTLLENYLKKAKKKAVYSEFRNHYLDGDYSKICEKLGFKWEGHYNIVQELPDNNELLWGQIRKKRREGINKASKQDFMFSEDHTENAVNTFYNLLYDSYKRIKLPVPNREFFLNCCIKEINSCCKIFHLTENNISKISLFSFLYKNTLYGYYIGTDNDRDFLKKRPSDLFQYEVLKWCLQNNVRFYDWMGAGKPGVDYGVRDFKLSYGGELVDFGRFTYIHSSLRFKVAKMGFTLLQKIGRMH